MLHLSFCSDTIIQHEAKMLREHFLRSSSNMPTKGSAAQGRTVRSEDEDMVCSPIGAWNRQLCRFLLHSSISADRAAFFANPHHHLYPNSLRRTDGISSVEIIIANSSSIMHRSMHSIVKRCRRDGGSRWNLEEKTMRTLPSTMISTGSKRIRLLWFVR